MTHGFDDKERVRQATDIVDLVGGYLPLRRQGSQYVGRCPWHDDRKPSLQVNPARQSWKCWVCDIGGDVFSFVMKRESIDFREALELLAERAGIELSRRGSPGTVAGSPSDKPTLYRATAWAARQYHECLRKDPVAEPARQYLASRGIHDAAVDRFMIGYAPPRSWLRDRSRSTPFTPEVLCACGLLASREQGDWYERFRGRLMFPIQDTQDRVIAFGGRILPQAEDAAGDSSARPQAKYINSPESRLYSKSDNLFGLNVARERLAQERNLVIVEGYTDVIAAWMAGVENTAAVCGTALNERHIRLIRRFADRITLVLDGDAAGQRRTNEILEHFVAADMDLRIMTLPEGQDPFDFLQARVQCADFRKRIDDAVDALEHKIRIETRDIDLIRDTHAASRALDNILTTIASSGGERSAATRLRTRQILTRLSRMFQIDVHSLHRRCMELRARPARRTAGDAGEMPRLSLRDLPGRERELLQILLRGNESPPGLVDRALETILPDQFVSGPCREIYSVMCECYHAGLPLAWETVSLHVEDPELKMLLNRLDEESQAKFTFPDLEPGTHFNSVIDSFEHHRLEQDQRQLMSSLTSGNLQPREEADILEQLFRQAKARQGIQ